MILYYKLGLREVGDFVHRGYQLVNEDEIVILKVLIDRIIMWILENSKYLKTKNHYSKFFQLVEQGPSNIRATKEMINHIEKLR